VASPAGRLGARVGAGVEATVSESARLARATAVTHRDSSGHDTGRGRPSVPAEQHTDAPGRSDVAQQLTALFRAHGDLVDRCLARAGVGQADRDDALQDVFLLAMRKLDAYRERGTARAWLVAIARRVASDRRRGERRRAAREEVGCETAFVAPAPDAAACSREDAELVHRFLRSLSPDMAECFVLCEIESMTAAEVAGALGVSVNTVYSRLRLARGKFRRAVADREKGGGRG
jgi:RNA polymerase sigma factor (sigma-70 family)